MASDDSDDTDQLGEIGRPSEQLENAEAAAPASRRSRIRLESAADVRRELVKVYRQVAEGRLTDIGAVRRARVLAEIRATIELGELEPKVRELLRGRGG